MAFHNYISDWHWEMTIQWSYDDILPNFRCYYHFSLGGQHILTLFATASVECECYHISTPYQYTDPETVQHGRNQPDDISKSIFLYKIFSFVTWSKFHWLLFPEVQLKTSQTSLELAWRGVDDKTSVRQPIHASPGSNGLNVTSTITQLINFISISKIPGIVMVVHNDAIKWRHFPRYLPFVRGIHLSPVNSHQKGQWRRHAELWRFLWSAPEQMVDVTVMMMDILRIYLYGEKTKPGLMMTKLSITRPSPACLKKGFWFPNQWAKARCGLVAPYGDTGPGQHWHR